MKERLQRKIKVTGTNLLMPALFFFCAAVGLITGCGRSPEVQSSEVASPAPPAPDFAPAGAKPEIVFLGQPGVDVAGGSENAPDGEPDLVVQVGLETALLKQIVSWEITTPGSYWTSKANPNGSWLIKVVNDDTAEPASGGMARVKLCFKGHPQILVVTLRAFDAEGIPLMQQTVRR